MPSLDVRNDRMAMFKADNIRQQTLLNVDFLEILGTDTFEYSLYRLLEREEIVEVFISQYKNAHVVEKPMHLRCC